MAGYDCFAVSTDMYLLAGGFLINPWKCQYVPTIGLFRTRLYMCTTLCLVGSVGPSENGNFFWSVSPWIPAPYGLSYGNYLTVCASVGLLQYIGAWVVWLDYTLNRCDGEVAWRPRCRGSITVLTACTLFDIHLGRKGKKAGHQHGKECSPDSFFKY
jgi:hypothetical protein